MIPPINEPEENGVQSRPFMIQHRSKVYVIIAILNLDMLYFFDKTG
jgi:hypothetical protein